MVTKYYEKFLESRTAEVDEKTIRAMRQTVLWLNCFERDYKKLTFANIDRDFYDAFHEIFNEYADSTLGKHIKHIKTFMKWAKQKGLHNNDWALTMKVKRGDCEEDALNSRELLRIWNSDYNMHEVMRLVEEEEHTIYQGKRKMKRFNRFLSSKDFFYALCSTAMYPNNLVSYQKSMIKKGMVVYKRNKLTAGEHNTCRVPYLDNEVFKFKTLSEKYGHNFDKPYRIYQDVRVLMKYIGIDKIINTRCGRRTCASIGHHELGWDESMIKMILGHTKFETSLNYMRVDNEMAAKKFKNTRLKTLPLQPNTIAARA